MFVAKWVSVILLLGLGIDFLLRGVGVAVPVITFHGFSAQQLPAGAFLVVAGIALARLWSVSRKEEFIERIIDRATARGR